jgi:type I restriction enzyme S subunit
MTMPEQKKAVTPRLRFPDFRDAGPWEVKRLGDVYRFIPTNSFSREQLTYESGTIKNIHYGDIHTKYRALFDVEREHVPFLIGNGVTEDFDDERFCVPGDIILADASEDLDDIGKAIEIVNIGSHKVVAGLHTLHARQLAEDLVIGFGGCLFQGNAIREQIRKQAQGAKVLGISATRLKSIKLAAPRKPEQQKIADCLSSLDELIELQAKQLEALQTHKKGLMQQLFPQEIDL